MISINKIIPETAEVMDSLQKDDNFLGAFIFGSFARGEQTDISDIDIKVIVKDGIDCTSVNHPILDNRKTDLSFNCMKTILEGTEKEMKDLQRIPMIAESIILFDKTGELIKIKNRAIKVKPKKPNKKETQWIQFMIYHLDNKVERFMNNNLTSAMLSMQVGINDLLKFHYQINQKWWVSSKRLLQDLQSWDNKVSQMLEVFLYESDTKKRFIIWTNMIDYVINQIGGRQKISENNCACNNCKKNLKRLLDK